MEATPIYHAMDEVSESTLVQETSAAVGVRADKPASPTVEEEKGPGQQLQSEDAAKDIAQKMNQVASVFNTSLAFSVDKSTGKTVIKVLDKETNKIIRQIPPKELLRLIGKMRNVMGMLLDVET